MKLCKDCRWMYRYMTLASYTVPACEHPNLMVENPVCGPVLQIKSCEEMRRDAEPANTCGPEGRWWQERPPGLWKRLFGKAA